MKIITINVPDQYLDDIEVLVNLGFFPSRSEAFREAIKQFIQHEMNFNTNLVSDTFQKLKENQLRCLVR